MATPAVVVVVNRLASQLIGSPWGGSSPYRLLDEEKKEIRLATIWPASVSTPHVQVTLDKVSLLERPSFEALSYCWGSADDSRTILLCGQERQVTANLDAALRQFLRDARGEPLRLWIDAICINQADDVEKGSQVALMREIYSNASNVRVWLGKETPLTAMGFRHLDYVLTHSDDYMKNPHPGGEDFFVPQEFRSVEAWGALGEIFRKQYWSRRWVTQEIILSKSNTLHCGRHVAGPFDDPLFFTAPLLMYSRRIQVAGMRIVGARGISQAVVDELSMMGDEANAIILATATMVQAQEPEEELTATMLNQFFRAEASDARDLVYGILGLLPADIGIQPDYSRRADDVFEDFAFRYMQNRRSLNMLFLGGRAESGLPSWVPNLRDSLRSASDHKAMDTEPGWSDKSMSPLLSVDQDHYDPSAGAIVQVSKPSSGSLAVRGMIVDRIIAIASKEREQNALRRITIQTILKWEKLYHSAMRNESGDYYPDVSIDDLIRTVSADSAQDSSTKKFRRCIPSDIGRYREILEDPVGCIERGDTTEVFNQWQWLDTLVNTNRFFVTATGRHGLLFGHGAVGDYMCVVASCVMPLCLRKMDSANRDGADCYALRGSAYVHGIMSGEAVLSAVEERGLACVDDAFEQITLR